MEEGSPTASPNGDGQPSALRRRNRDRVLGALRATGTASRADVARLTGLSRSTVSGLVAELQAQGLVVEAPDGDPARGHHSGRPAIPLALNPSAGGALGIDLGHGHLTVAVADLSARVLAERRRVLDVDRSAHQALDAAAELAEEALAEAGLGFDALTACAMGLPGPVDQHTGLVGSTVILPGWAELPAAEEMSARLGVPVRVDNDANLGALGEVAFGAGRGAHDVLYVKVASGIGAGLVLNGRLHRGVTGIAGEIGHVLAAPDGRVCRCGKRGCLETVAGAPALLDLLRPAHGDQLETAGLIALAAGGDIASRRLLEEAGRAVGRALADLCNCLNPELIVVGGELGAAGAALLDGVRESIDRFALPAAADAVRVVAGVLGDRAEVLGALALAIRDTEATGVAGPPGLTERPTPAVRHVQGGVTP